MNFLYLILSTLIFSFFSSVSNAQIADWQWANNFGGGKDDGGDEVIVRNGSLYIAGSFSSDSIRLGDTTLRNTFGNSTCYTAKMDKQGNLLWAKTSGAAGYMVMDSSSNIYRIINFKGRIVLNGDTMRESQPLGVNSYCIAKFDSNGNKLWMKYWSPLGKLEVRSACVDNIGNLYAAGFINRDTVYVNGDTLASTPSGENIVVLKFDTAGNIVWGKAAVPQNQVNRASAIVCDGEGNLIVTGSCNSDSLTIDNSVLPQKGMFLLKLTGQGNVVWLKGITNTTSASGESIAINEQEACIYVSGLYYNAIWFGADTSRGDGIFTGKFNFNGDLLWLKSSVASTYHVLNRVDNAGNVVLVGDFRNVDLIFGTDTLYRIPFATNLFFVKYSSAGNVLTANSSADSASVFYPIGLDIDEDGSAYVSGVFNGMRVTFGSYTLYNFNNKEDIFLAKYSGNIISGITASTIDKNSLSLYPNPCTNSLTIAFGDKNFGPTYRIYDISGRAVISGNMTGNNEIIDVKQLNPGMYLFQITADGQSAVSKFVVQR